VVCTPSSASRVAMGHWGNAPTPQGWQDTDWSPWGYLGGAHTNHHHHIRRSRLHIRQFELQFGFVRWFAHHLQHLGSPGALGAIPSTPQGWQDTDWSPWQGAHTPPPPHSALPTPYSTVRIAVRVRTVVCTPFSASRVAMGHWGNSPHTQGMTGHCLVTLGGHTHTTTTTFGTPDTIFNGSNCGSGFVRWCAHNFQHLGSPWGIGGNSPHT
jgi:hypothetical protein